MKLPEQQDGNVLIFNGKKINYKDEGDGIALILLHGYLESIEIWKDFSESLTEHFRVIRIDLPGHGMSELFEEVQTCEYSQCICK